ncbi:Pkinase-domain-containing protein [Schizopora paradoxa]|uniref:Pkinase-domain-containing protein n=1 Tax=Schizopora paradoxa TaxID=27342 RepID=A0A0H2SLX3_9AGAM|nr:Pkinase-domain-containing protein [Schizopora paradoxa]
MPTGGVVIDAFKNLIRHGKQHHERTQQQDVRQQREKELRAQDQALQPLPQNKSFPKDPVPSPNYRREAEMIVQEENEAKSKLPTYKGLEGYKLVEKMGDGAFSNVYKAIDLASGQKVAVKVVRKFELNSSQDGNKHLNPQFKKRPRVTERANILKEVSIMRGINHPSIVKLLQFFESEEHYFLVLELMEGGELFHQIVKLTYFSENLARHVILQVAEGIRYLHEDRGVVHRDIKPENLLFERVPIIPSSHPVQRQYDEEKEDEGEFVPGRGGGGIGRVKIADFGLSKIVWDSQTMTPCGTVGYTAPEIVKDERYSKSVDMWALGCVLYTLLCGFPPFYDESINVLTEKVARGYYTFLSPWWDDISASSKDLITHLLCVDPAQRYTIQEFLNHPWCKEAPAPLPPPTPNLQPTGHRAIDSPLLQSLRGGREARSPGLHTLKEAFDITYAVHRMEEEGARRRAGGGGRGFLQNLNEDDEDMEDDAVLEEARMRERRSQEESRKAASAAEAVSNASRNRSNPRTAPKRDMHLDGGRAGPRDRHNENQHRVFALDIDNATLLGRRHRKNGPGTMQSSPLTQVTAPYADPGSPMRLG